MHTINNLLEKIERHTVLDFGTIFSESIELFKKSWLQGFLLQLFTIIIILPLIIIMYIPLITIALAQEQNGYEDTLVFNEFFAGMSILYILFMFVGIFVLGTLSVAMNAAFFRILKKLDHGETVSNSDFFHFIKGKYLSKIFVLMMASFGIAIAALLLCYFPIFYVMVPMSFFAVIYAFNPELGVGEIVKLSFKIGTKNWLISFGLMFVASALSQIVGIMLCGIGMIFTASFVYHPIYLIYKHVIGFDVVSPVDQIGVLPE